MWATQMVNGWMSYVLKEKLKGFKSRLKVWNKDEYGGLENRMLGIVDEIKELDVKGDVRNLSLMEVETISDLIKNLRSRWSKIFWWIGVITPPNSFVQLECWIGGALKKRKKDFWLIWHTFVWGGRNCRGDQSDLLEMVEFVWVEAIPLYVLWMEFVCGKLF